MHQDDTGLLIVALFALGMALAFVIADRDSPISRAMSAALAATGVAVALNVLVAAPLHARHEEPPWDGIFALPETLAFVFAFEWLLRVLRTIPAERIEEEKWLRLAQGLALLYGALSLILPETRTHQFVNILRHDPADFIHLPSYSGFLMFAGPLAASHLCAAYAGFHAYRRHPDRAETRRVLAFLAGAPFLLVGMILPLHTAPFAAAGGLIVFLVGAVQFHVTQGRRAEFMSRFLAPQVAQLVAHQGLERATAVQTLEISVVCCDLRGFTAYSVETSPAHVIEILRKYYDAVGAAAARYGGTIKDQAGDGVLILIGAPFAFPDHAVRALSLAEDILRSTLEVTRQRSDEGLHMGIGVGVASGAVSVGVIGTKSRLEYTAVGPAVNLAARLCSEAADGEILIAAETRERVRADPVFKSIVAARDVALKGIGNAVTTYTLAKQAN
jgi:class 3 adenylate cyclase